MRERLGRLRVYVRPGGDKLARGGGEKDSPIKALPAGAVGYATHPSDGEALLLGVDGCSDFNGLHSRKPDHEVEFYVFDILISDGDDLRRPCASGCALTSSPP